ncbi:MAG: xanthine dehydrogenase family protein molybdopterin-binding subunit, partial [Acidobacteria bacterium]|nr:xanthine dehydrogenase family protein molybdopterin-binding subunit [Acidobacteriota bacterium]
ALDIEWEVLPHVVDLLEGRKPDYPVIRPVAPAAPAKKAGASGGMGGGGNNPPKQGNVSYSIVNNGDIEAGFRDADHIIEYDVNTAAFCGHIPNPVGTVAWFFDDPLYGPGKNLRIEGVPWGGIDGAARSVGLSSSKAFQGCMFVGGRYCDWGTRKSQQITPQLARRFGRPVRCMNSRYDMYDFNLNDRFVHIKIGFKANGLITAIDDFSIADGGVVGSTNFGNTMDQTYGPYFTTRCKNVKQYMEVIDSNRGKMYTSGQHNPMSWDSLMVGLYVIAEKLGKDPIDIATLNLHGPESQDDPNPVPSYEACVAELKKMMNWNWHAAGAKKLPDGRMHGASFRYNQCPRHSVSGYNPKLELRNGVVHLESKGPIIGHYGLEANMMVIAEELGLEFKDIQLDLDHHYPYRPFGGGADGSTASSWAIKECANILKKRILEAAVEEAENPPAAGGFGGFGGFGKKQAEPSPFKGLKPEDLDMQDGKVVVKADPSKGVPLGQAVRANLFATYSGRPPAAVWTQQGRVLDAMDVATCEVALDTETGEVEILRFGVVADPGKIMRRTSLESQIDQVMDFSTGCQLQEEFVFDQKTGVRLSANMFDYKKVSMLDMPKVDLRLLETHASNACYGGSGISHSLANTHLVIMAIHNAIGKWVGSPATPDRVLKALGKA